jgi:predicted dehydrogenase
MKPVYGPDMGKPLRVGIIGLSAERGWAAAAHIPALHALSNDFELVGVANSKPRECAGCRGSLWLASRLQEHG